MAKDTKLKEEMRQLAAARRAEKFRPETYEGEAPQPEPEEEVVLDPSWKRAQMYRVGVSPEVLEDLRQSFGDRKSYVPDSNATAFHEGQRDVYLMIKLLIERGAQAPPQREK